MFAGCGQLNSVQAKQYGWVNKLMYEGMSINWTGNAEYDFIAGMIPHHAGAGQMCEVYENATSSDHSTHDHNMDATTASNGE